MTLLKIKQGLIQQRPLANFKLQKPLPKSNWINVRAPKKTLKVYAPQSVLKKARMPPGHPWPGQAAFFQTVLMPRMGLISPGASGGRNRLSAYTLAFSSEK